MLRSSRLLIRLVVACVLMTATVVVVASPGAAQDEGTLRDRIDSQRDRESSLASAADRLAALERKATREVDLLNRRLGQAQSEVDRTQRMLDDARDDLRAAKARALRLRARLTEVRAKLRDSLSERYRTGRPDLVTVLVQADGFAELLERFRFLEAVEERDTDLLGEVRSARTEALGERRELTTLERRRRTLATTMRARRDALAKVQGALEQRRASLAAARAARERALEGTRSNRRAAEKELRRLEKEREKANTQVGPGGPWAIPWPIVECESGGQNFPPNFAGASGYYQFLPQTWRGLGGSTPQAYQAPKAEQDKLAAKLWAGGAGARNWVCAGLVD